jgi:carbamoyl-phosphate synthase small subunit
MGILKVGGLSMKQARLALEDGMIFYGESFGAPGTVGGEVVFNTGMTGYQEILTDPSYSGQIITMTYPLIGNYGLNRFDYESAHPFARGLVVREYCEMPSNWRSEICIDDFLKQYQIPGICGIDTRALTKYLRTEGTMKGIITTEADSDPELLAKVKALPALSGQNFVKTASATQPYTVGNGSKPVVLIDYGAKGNIIQCLVDRGCKVTVVPCDTTSSAILDLNPAGIMLTNGPGDPKDVSYAVATVKKLIGKLPVFGICLGHQIIGLALGGDTYKLKFGHRGGNHPVKDLSTGKVSITSQNHGFAVLPESLDPDEVIISHRNVNDATVEGLRHKYLPVFSVQYHPEAAPGPKDSEYLFDEFVGYL